MRRATRASRLGVAMPVEHTVTTVSMSLALSCAAASAFWIPGIVVLRPPSERLTTLAPRATAYSIPSTTALSDQSSPDDPPITEFEAKIPSLGPQETHDVSATANTKLRLYELPDWQFLRADFDITSPEP